MLDRADNNPDGAIACFEDVLKSLEKEPSPMFENICLLNLTETEIETMDVKALGANSDLSGPWMQRLFEHAETKDLPGIMARGKILKARLRQKQERFTEMQTLIGEVQETALKHSSMRCLNQLVDTTFPDIITEKAQRPE
jgi:hypothetical protein